MKRLLHISDLHFGKIHPPAIESLGHFLVAQEKRIDLIVNTGDWTQRARLNQYRAAAEFIKKLPLPVLAIPGNHDIPLYNIFSRWTAPFRNYNRYIKKLTIDTFADPEFVVVGFRTAHPLRATEGRLLQKDVDRAQEIFAKGTPQSLKIVACHHPLFQPQALAKIKPRSLARDLMHLNPDIILSGHSHLNWIELVASETAHKTLHISAGSATSSRLRGEGNSFHILEIEGSHVRIETYFLSENGFILPEGSKAKSIELPHSFRHNSPLT